MGRTIRVLTLSLVLAASAVAGVVGAGPALAADPEMLEVFAGTGTFGSVTEGPATDSALGIMATAAVDGDGNVYLADRILAYVYKVSADGELSVFAGTGGAGAPVPGPATESPIQSPGGLAVDSDGNLYVIDIRQVLKITPAGDLSVFAGTGTFGDPTPGPATSSNFRIPSGLAVDADDSVFITDAGERRVLEVTPDGTLSIFAGTGDGGTPSPGPAADSDFGSLNGITVDAAGVVYVCDSTNHLVLKIDTDGDLSVLAGTGTSGVSAPGPATSSDLDSPTGVAADDDGNVYIVDRNTSQVTKVDTDGDLSIYAGNSDGTWAAPVEGPAADSPLNAPQALALDAYDRLYIVDTNNYVVERVTGTEPPAAPTGLDPTPGDEQFDLSFLPGDPGSSPITGYQVSIDDCDDWATLTTSAGPSGTRVGQVTGVTNGTTYDVCLRALNALGAGEASEVVQVTLEDPVAPPGAPTGLRAAPKDRAVRLWWTPPGDNGGAPILGYEVDLHASNSWAHLVISAAPGGERTAVIGGLRNGGTYRPRIRAVNSAGGGAPSARVTVKPAAPGRR